MQRLAFFLTGIMKTAIIFGLTAAAFLLGRKKTDGNNTNNNDTEDDAAKDVVNNELTYKQSWYSQTAEMIETNAPKTVSALAFWKTDANHKAAKSILGAVLLLKNKSDYNLLLSKFGKRKNFFAAENINTLPDYLIHYLDFDIEGSNKTTYLDLAKRHLKKYNIAL